MTTKTNATRGAAAACIAAALTLTALPSAEAAPGYRTASNSFVVKSWVGIPVYTMGVRADYYSNGSRITGHYGPAAATATHYPGWSVQSRSAAWTYKGSTSSIVTAHATFFYGLDTQWVKIGIQSYDETIRATAYR